MAFRKRPRALRRSIRLSCDSLENRITPAFTMFIDGDAVTANVSSSLAGGVRTFTASGSGAILDVDDIETALNAGENVVITNGSAGAEPGFISWSQDSAADTLDYSAAALRSLTIQTDTTSNTILGFVSLNGATLNFADNLALTIDVTAQGADSSINITNNGQINSARSVNLKAGTGAGNVLYGTSSTAPTAVSGGVTISGAKLLSLDSTTVISSTNGPVSIGANVDLSLASLSVRAENNSVVINGTIDGPNDFSVYGTAVNLNGAIGAVTPLNSLTLAGGQTTFASTIDATTVSIGDFVLDTENAVVSGSGTITATGGVFANFDGTISPGGAGTTGSMNITGNLTFDFGSYALDLGATPDIINVSGDLIINGGNLGTAASSGQLAVPTNLKIIDFDGTLAGAFDNAPLNSGLIVGQEALQVTNYGPAATDVTIAQVAANPGNVFTGAANDGTAFTVKLTGDGTLTAFKDAFGTVHLFTRNTTQKSKIGIKTKANASSGTVTLGSLTVNGDLGGLTAATANLIGFPTAIRAFATPGATGAIKAISLLSLVGDIQTPGAIGALTTKFGANTNITAASLGTLKIGSILTGAGFGSWNIAHGISSLTAGQIQFLNVSAKFIGKLSVVGDKKNFIAPDLGFSNFNLSGNDGSPKTYGLKSASVLGTVRGVTFDLEDGNVGSVSVGRFISSRMYLDYTPGLAFNTGGTFDSLQQYRIEKFTTTAKTIGDAGNPLNFAFANSEIVADSLGPIKLSGLKTDNPFTPFGIKFRTSAASVQTATSSNPAIPVKSNLVSSGSALADQFFFLDV